MANNPPQGYSMLVGSERQPPRHGQPVGPVNPDEPIEVSVYLRDPAQSALVGNAQDYAQSLGPKISREAYAASHSASPLDIAKVGQFAGEHHLNVVSVDPVSRKVVLAGTVGAMMSAFGTHLKRYEYQGRSYRGRSGHLYIPKEIEGIVTGVFGLDNRPQAEAHLRSQVPVPVPPRAAPQATPYTPPQLGQLYDFPSGLDGSGQCIALIELGGGYKDQDLTTYFQQLGITKTQVVRVSVDGGQNSPAGDPNSADGEVALDIEIAGSLAPGARVAVYFAPNTDQGFIDAITQAIHDTTNKPSVISISWGGPESTWTAQAMQTMDQAFQTAASLGISVCCAAGDNGSSDGVSDQKAHVDFPASSSFALGCGGTRVTSANNQLTDEVVWNETANGDGATGGGVSDTFALPTWQENAHVPPSINDNKHVGRGVPDVAGNADPQTGYQVYVDSQQVTFGGTSAVAPLWAALITRINQKRGQAVGYLNPYLYQNYQQLSQNQAFHDITSGNNGGYTAGPGWDACTGLGSPDGAKLLQALPPPQTS